MRKAERKEDGTIKWSKELKSLRIDSCMEFSHIEGHEKLTLYSTMTKCNTSYIHGFRTYTQTTEKNNDDCTFNVIVCCHDGIIPAFGFDEKGNSYKTKRIEAHKECLNLMCNHR